MIYLETLGNSQPYFAFLTFEFHSCQFVFGTTHMATYSLTLHKAVSVGSCVKSH